MSKLRLFLVLTLSASMLLVITNVVAASERWGNVRFSGTVSSLPAGTYGVWVIDGRSVNVSPATEIRQRRDAITVGSFVEVRAFQQADGSLTATRIESRNTPRVGRGETGNFRFQGAVQTLPAGLIGSWTVDGRRVEVSASTIIRQPHGPIAVGSLVEVRGLLQADGSVIATRLDGKAASRDNRTYVEFYAVVQSVPSGMLGTWVIGGRQVNVGTATVIQQKYGPIAVGSLVEVKGQQQPDGSVSAFKIEGEDNPSRNGYTEFYGTVQSIPPNMQGVWIVGGRTVNVSASTFIQQRYGPITVGSLVEVKGFQQSDGSVNASRIEDER